MADRLHQSAGDVRRRSTQRMWSIRSRHGLDRCPEDRLDTRNDAAHQEDFDNVTNVGCDDSSSVGQEERARQKDHAQALHCGSDVSFRRLAPTQSYGIRAANRVAWGGANIGAAKAAPRTIEDRGWDLTVRQHRLCQQDREEQGTTQTIRTCCHHRQRRWCRDFAEREAVHPSRASRTPSVQTSESGSPNHTAARVVSSWIDD